MKIQKRITRLLTCLCIVLFVSVPIASAEPNKEIPSDSRCPVCGMFVAKYPKWICQIRLNDNSLKYFDGIKDMMRFYFSPEKYAGGSTENIKEIWVKDYYTLNWVDGKSALYVIGSNVFGPMGKELVPFAAQETAGGFLKDHHGKQVLTFTEITPEIVQSLFSGGHKKMKMMKH